MMANGKEMTDISRSLLPIYSTLWCLGFAPLRILAAIPIPASNHSALQLSDTVRAPAWNYVLMQRSEASRTAFVAALSAIPAPAPQAAELSAGDARLLDAAGLIEDSEGASCAEARTAERISQLVQTALTVDEVATGLGITTTQVQQIRLERRLWGISDGNSWIFPVSQFNVGDNSRRLHVISGLDLVFAALPEDLHPLAIEGFLVTPQPGLFTDRPMTPLQWLHNGGPIADAVAVASATYQ